VLFYLIAVSLYLRLGCSCCCCLLFVDNSTYDLTIAFYHSQTSKDEGIYSQLEASSESNHKSPVDQWIFYIRIANWLIPFHLSVDPYKQKII